MPVSDLKKFIPASILSCFALGAIAIAAGVRVSDSLFAALVIAVQMHSGMLFWILLNRKKAFTIPELIGLGIAFGSLFSLLSVYAFQATAFRDISWLFPSVLITCALFLPTLRSNFFQLEIRPTSGRDISFIFSATVFALSLLWIWALPLVLVPFIFTWLQKRLYQLFVIPLSVAALVASQFLRNSSTSWWIFSHDQMYLEGFSEGIYRYGQNENMHLVGYGFPYHWFSLLWSATVTHAADLAPLVGLGIILPIVSLFACINLLWTITNHHSKVASYVSVISFVLGSNAINWTAIRFTNSPTFLFSLIWLLAFIYIFQLALKQNRFILDLVLGFLLFGAFGGKVTHGIVILSGLGVVLLSKVGFSKEFKDLSRLIRMYGVLSFATLLIYFLVYRGQRVGGRMLYISPGELGFQVGVAYMSSTRWIWIVASIAVLIGCSSMFIIAMKNRSRFDSDRDITIFAIGSFFISLILTLVLAQEGGSQGYFLLSASVIILIPASKAIAQMSADLKTLKPSAKTIIVSIFCAIFCLGAVRFWNSTPSGVDVYRFGLIFKILVLAMPCIFFVISQTFFRKACTYHGYFILFAAFLIFGVSHRFFAAETYFDRFSIDQQIEPISGSDQRIEALTWLRQNSHENDLVATNRFCIPNVDPCAKKWYLVSAISRRRLLIEGFGYGLPVGKGASIASERMINSIEFGRKPNEHLWEYLKTFNVKWFVIDAAAERVTNSWEPYANVVFQNSEMKILRISDHL